MSERTKESVPAPLLSATCLALAAGWSLLLPPEVHPEGGAGVAALLVAGLILARRPVSFVATAVASGLVLVNLACSLAPGRTLEILTRGVLVVAAFLLAARISRKHRWLVFLATSAAGVLLVFHAIFQKAGLLAWQASWARAAGAPAEMVARLEEGRAFATHVVPAALAGGLVVALAAGMALAARGGFWRWVGWSTAGLAVAGLVLTSSIGGFLALVTLLAVVLAPRLPHWSPRILAAGLGLLIVTGVGIVLVRPVSPLDFQRPDHPLRLRAGNWRCGVVMSQRQPVLGAGLGSFGALYPGVRREEDRPTVYAHNSWLQLVIEGGLPAAVLLIAGAWLGFRRLRTSWGGNQSLEATEDQWVLAAGAAFAVHNLVDFTAYLPGVAIPVMALTGLAWSREEKAEKLERAIPARWAGLVGVVTALLAVAGMWGAEALARRALERGWDEIAQGNIKQGAQEAGAAARWAPWSPGIQLKSGRALAACGQVQVAEEIAAGLTILDPESPAGWHLLGDLWDQMKRPADAWRAFERAALRHPADGAIKQRIARLEQAFRAEGLLAEQSGLLSTAPRPQTFPWDDWDQFLLLFFLALIPLAIWRWLKPGPAPVSALTLGVLLFLVPWGEGGALPGARLGRQLLIAAAFLFTLFPRSRTGDDQRNGLTPAPWRLALPLMIWAGISALFAPDRAAARDGFLVLSGAAVLFALAWELSRRFLPWPEVVLFLGAAAASVAGLLWVGQQVALRLGVDLDAMWVPLRVARGDRPAADFLHPGHLGTFLAAAGLGLLGFGLAASRGRLPFVMGALLVLLGLGGGARATLVAVAAGGLVLFLLAVRPRQRRLALTMLIPALLAGAALVWFRFSGGDPYAWTRWSIWKACLGALADHPWLGFGPDGFSTLAAKYSFADIAPVARFGRIFRGPHSDLLGAFLALGLPGGLLLCGLIVRLMVSIGRAARARLNEEPSLAGCAAAATALLAHGLFDDFLGERPAAAVFFALLLGSAAGRLLLESEPAPPLWRPKRATAIGLVAFILTALIAGEIGPWFADRLWRQGEPMRAARVDSWRSHYWAGAAGAVSGTIDRRLALAMERTARAVEALPEAAEPWVARASVLDEAWRGPLQTEDTFNAAVAAWNEALTRRPQDVQVRRLLARLLAAGGQTSGAEAALRRVIQDEPNDLGARLDLARLLAENGRMAEARQEAARLEQVAAKLKGVTPENGYAAALITVSAEDLARLRALLAAGTP